MGWGRAKGKSERGSEGGKENPKGRKKTTTTESEKHEKSSRKLWTFGEKPGCSV